MKALRDIPKNRLILYIIILGLLPPLLLGLQLWSQKNELDQLENQIQFVRETSLIKMSKQSVNLAAHEHFKDADHFYLDKNLETMAFLQPEIDTLHNITENKNFAGDENLSKRLGKLTGKENQILFSGGQVLSYPTFQETLLSLINPIEINTDDIKKILAAIEGVAIGEHQSAERRPQLIITDFKIDKKEVSKENEVFLLNIKLLKREYL